MTVSKEKPLSDNQIRLIMKALADPRRYEIVKRLSDRSKAFPCEKIRDCMEVSAATLSHHMKELEMAGLVEVVREGKFASYVLQREVLEAFLKQVKMDLT